MRLLVDPGPGNPAEWWAVWVAIGLGLLNLYLTWRTRRELHLPGWRVLLRPYQWSGAVYVEDEQSDGKLRLDRSDVVDRGSEWVLENVGRGDASHVRLRTAFDWRSQLRKNRTGDLGHFDAQQIKQFATGLDGVGWPSIESYSREVARLDRWQRNRIRVIWVTPQGGTRRKWVRVQIDDLNFRDDGPPQIEQRPSPDSGGPGYMYAAMREQLLARGVLPADVDHAFRGEAYR